MDDLRYPIGKFAFSGGSAERDREGWIADIAAAPAKLRDAVRGLSGEQLDTPYRPGGWTVRQVVHHVPDSHLNAYVRFKLALTEHAPTIKPYDEARWAELVDSKATPLETSLSLLQALHERWVILLRALGPADFARTFMHPEHGRALSLEWMLAQYAWHSRHHVAHITSLRERMHWA